MIIEISVAVAVLIFAVIAVFLIQALINLNKTLIAVRRSLSEAERRLQSFDSSLNAFSNVSEICEDKASKLKNFYFAKNAVESSDTKPNYTPDLTDLVIVGVKLFDKLFRKR